MTSRTAAFFEQKREWSRRKHEVFEGYAPQFSRILGRDRGPIYLVDAFAGGGSYGNGEQREDGSPLLAAKIAKELAERGFYSLRCINVEADPGEFADLAESTAAYRRFVDNRQGRFAEHADQILRDVGVRPTLVFLDPFGVGGLDWTTLEKLGNRARDLKTELLINFNAPKFDRHAGWLDSFGRKPREAFIALLNRTCGTDEWQAIWDEPLPKDERYQRIMQFYLGRICTTFKFGGAAYPVHAVENEQLKYYLLYLTRHPLGLRIMSSILYGVERRYLEDRARLVAARGQQLALFDPPPPSIDELESAAIEQLEADVLDVGLRRIRTTSGALQDALIRKWFGRMVQKHYRKVYTRLIRQGRILRDKATGIDDDTVLTFR
jgi:three-Cys-motif partner protein